MFVVSAAEVVTAPFMRVDRTVTAGLAAAEFDCVISIERVGMVDVQNGSGRRPSSARGDRRS